MCIANEMPHAIVLERDAVLWISTVVMDASMMMVATIVRTHLWTADLVATFNGAYTIVWSVSCHARHTSTLHAAALEPNLPMTQYAYHVLVCSYRTLTIPRA